MNILLLGVLGSGKTSVGQALANNLNYKFVELDHEILKITGYSSIEEIYQKNKSLWEECELEITKDVSTYDNQVIACGGAMVMNHLNIQYFIENKGEYKIIYLETSVEELLKRIHHRDSDLGEDVIKGRIEKVLTDRDYFYRFYATDIINTENKSIRDLILEIKAIL